MSTTREGVYLSLGGIKRLAIGEILGQRRPCSGVSLFAKRIEYILEGNLQKKCTTAILLYCFHTAGVLHIFLLYNLLGPGTSFYRKSKINIKRKPNYEIGWFHN